MGGIFVIVWGAIFVLLGILMIVNLIRDRKLCTYPVDAKVAEVILTRRRGHGRCTARTAVFEYYFEGNVYRIKDNVGTSEEKYHTDDIVELYIEPEKPEHFYCPKNDKEKYIIITAFTLMGGFVLWFGILIANA